MTRYRLKEVEEVEARQFTGGEESARGIIAWVNQYGGVAHWVPRSDYIQENGTVLHTPRVLEHIVIQTTNEKMQVLVGEWLIRDFLGGFAPCTPGYFEATWEEVA